jgi:hypothetical protein
VRQHDRVFQPLAQLDRDRCSGAVAALHEGGNLLGDELPELVDLEADVRVRSGEHTPDRARDGAHARPALGELAAGRDEALQELGARA